MPAQNLNPPQVGKGALAQAEGRARNFLTIGNSTSTAAQGDWTSVFATFMRTRDTFTNSAAGGQTTQYFITNFATLVDAFYVAGKRNEILFFEGSQWLDDNYGTFGSGWTDGALAYPKTAEFCALARGGFSSTRRWLVRMITIDLWNDGEQPIAGYHTAIGQYNTTVRANRQDYDGLIDFAASTPIFDGDNDPNTWYLDEGVSIADPPHRTKVHKTASGILEMGNRIGNLYLATVGA